MFLKRFNGSLEMDLLAPKKVTTFLHTADSKFYKSQDLLIKAVDSMLLTMIGLNADYDLTNTAIAGACKKQIRPLIHEAEVVSLTIGHYTLNPLTKAIKEYAEAVNETAANFFLACHTQKFKKFAVRRTVKTYNAKEIAKKEKTEKQLLEQINKLIKTKNVELNTVRWNVSMTLRLLRTKMITSIKEAAKENLSRRDRRILESVLKHKTKQDWLSYCKNPTDHNYHRLVKSLN